MQRINSLNDFEVLLKESLDVCVIEIAGEPYHNMIKLVSYLDFDSYGMIEVRPSICYVDDYLEQTDLYKSIWDYASDFTSYKIPLYVESMADLDPIAQMYMAAKLEAGFKVDEKEDSLIIMKPSEMRQLRSLNSGIYLVGFENEREKASQSPRDE